VTVAEPDESWAVLGRAACAELRPVFVEIEHVGSTSVPGLAAKPVIDLMAAVEALEDVGEVPGFTRVQTDMPERLFFQRFEPDGSAYHLHVVTAASWPTRNERLLRDYLREHPVDARRYAALKRELMVRYGPGETYTRGKTELIQELTDKARAARGLPSVPVWED
jgi:GrpB-like predicted nucleotidyltransferase (UPF0157 family)